MRVGVGGKQFSITKSKLMEKGGSLLLQKVQQLKQSIVGSGERKGIISKQHVINGFCNGLYFDRLTLLDWALTVVVVAQLLLLHCYFELDLAGNPYAPWFVYGSTACGGVACLVLVLRFLARNHLLLVTEGSQESVWELGLKVGLCLVMPYPFTEGLVVEERMELDDAVVHSGTIHYKLNYLLIILACFRITYFSTSLLVRSTYMSPRAGRICKMYGAEPGLMFCLRSLFKDAPFAFITSIFVVSVFLFSFAFRIAECDVYETSSASTYSNMIWMTIITMTTVGYGDYSPKTDIGRLIGALCVSWGVLIVSVMVVVLTNAFSMNRNQSQSLNILKKLETNTELRGVAGAFIRESLWRIWKNYKYRLHRQERMHERKLMLRFRHFRRLRDMSNISQSEIDFYNELVRQFERAFINLQNLTSNNLMIINYLNEEYIFKQALPDHPDLLPI